MSISGLSDNLGNTWNLLTGPTLFSGNSFTLLSAIYYVNSPATSATHTVTVQLTNPAPLVLHVFAVSGSDVTGPPIFSAITDPGAGGQSANVTTAPITVPINSLLLSWVKNENERERHRAQRLHSGYAIDQLLVGRVPDRLLALVPTRATFSTTRPLDGRRLSSASRRRPGPVAFSQTVTTEQDTPVDITLTATSPQGFPLTYTVLTVPTHGTLSGSAPNLTYTPNAGYIGPDAFTFRVNDGTTNSNTATVSIIVRGLAPVRR